MSSVSLSVSAQPATRASHPWITRLRRHPTLVVGSVILLIILAMTVFASYVGTVDPMTIAPARRLKPPSLAHFFGTDVLGRDLYSRVVFGGRVSLVIGVSVALAASVAGVALGLATGMSSKIDRILMRVMDGMMAIPSVLLAIALMALTQASVKNVVVAITLTEIPRVVRLIRGVVLTLRDQPFVEAAISTGTRMPALILRHILPNTVAPLLVQATYICASAMLIEATLSFLGAGTPPATPSWGNIMAEGRAVFQISPYSILFPGLLLSLTVLAVNLVGDGLRDALDPRLSRLM